VSTEALTAFLDRVPREVMVALDEAYVEFLEQPPDLVKEIREGTRPNVIVMRTFSKIYGLAGLRLGYGIANPDLIAELEKVRQPFNVNAIAQVGALAALDDTGHAEKTKRMTSRGLKLYARTFKKMGLQFIPSHANFILVRVGDGQRVFNELQKAGVIVRPMASYQLPEWVRITMGTPKQNERCLDALKHVLEQETA
jgi:histidinol-phosphate aminotransferase